jgi:antitoxin YefM
MDANSYTKARANLAGTMERVCEDHAPVTITPGRTIFFGKTDRRMLRRVNQLIKAAQREPFAGPR